MEFLDSMAREHNSRESDGELSDVIPYQGSKKRPNPLSSSSFSSTDSESEVPVAPRDSAPARKKYRKSLGKAKENNENELLEELRMTNKLIVNLSKKMKSHDTRLRAIENQLSQSSSGVSSSPAAATSVTPKRSKAQDVPCEVRVSCK